MKRVLLLSLFAVSGCLNFDEVLDAGCARDASWAECRMNSGDGGPGDDAGTSDAGTSDAGTSDAGTTMDDGGCGSMLGNGTWCWENPGPFGAPDLFAIWGTSDNDVWVAGSGGALLHFDGTTWATSRVSLAPTLGMYAPEPTVRAVAVDDAGVAWLVGEEMKVFALERDGGLVGSYGSVSNRISTSSFGGATRFLSAGGSMVELGQVTTGGNPTFMQQSLPGSDNAIAVSVSSEGTFVAYERVSPDTAVVLEVPGTVAPLVTPNTSNVRNPRVFSRREGVPMLACTTGDLFERADGGWNWKGLYSLSEDLRSHAFDMLPDGGFRWWVTGAAGTIASLENFDAGLAVQAPGMGSALFGTWVSPTGHLWAAGLDGTVTEVELVNGASTVTPHGALNDVNLLDVAVSGDRAVAVGRGGVTFTRDALTKRWARQADPRSYDYRAVALGPGSEVCTLDLLGHVACDGSDVQLDDLFLADGGLIPTGDRGGGLAIRSDGGAIAALGDIVLTRTGGSWIRLDAGITTPHLNDLALSPNGFAVVTNEFNSSFDFVNGRLIIFDGAARYECQPGAGSLSAVARTANGFAVVGINVVGECSATGVFTAITTPPSEWVSVWVDRSGGWWILDRTGAVLRRSASGGAWQRERLPIGGSAFDGPSAQRITGDDDEVYVVCKQGGVLRRRWTP